MVKKNKKFGFTLAEALVVLLVISLFLAASAKVITKKKKPETDVYQHGQYECWLSGSHSSQYIIEKVPQEKITGQTKCSFTPTLNAAIYHVYVIYPNMGGYKLDTVHNITQDLDITVSSTKVLIKNSLNKTLEYLFSDAKTGSYSHLLTILEYTNSDSNFMNTTYPGILIVW